MQDRELSDWEKERNMFREIFGWIIYLFIIIVLTYILITFVGQRTRVSGRSMEPGLSDGDNLIVDKLSFRFRDPERFEIIVFPYEHAIDTYYIKRIVGLPGERVQIAEGYIYINGERLEEPYGKEPMSVAGIAQSEITLQENEYFVLGDNRNHSSDSRQASIGSLHRDEILGRAWVRIWPINQIGVIPHE